MTSRERLYFEALSKDRMESADILEKPSMRGIKNSVVEKYSDQAHFIYELLQNADDAHATAVRFVLEPTRLIFSHNGRRLFAVSDPSKEDSDSRIGILGDINAITSIANSNKTEASIGKFGVGFKAVFQYTQTPRIYDPNFRFKIERFIVPRLLTDDFEGRREGETLFVFPFDHPERDADEAFDDISNKLMHLTYPLLFLTELKSIEYSFNDVRGFYNKHVVETITFGSVRAEMIRLDQRAGNDESSHVLWLFTEESPEKFHYSVGFFMNDSGHLMPVREPAFCFFPTKEVTGLNFIIHAPFLLTDSREGIRAGIGHNDNMIRRLADLSAQALLHLKSIGVRNGQRIIDDKIIDIIPYDPTEFSHPSNRRKVSFLPFYESIQTLMGFEEILPTEDGYISTPNAYWASQTALPKLFSNEQLAVITQNPKAHWVFTSIGREEVQRTNATLFNYISSLVRDSLNEDVILSRRKGEAFYNRALGLRQNLENVQGITASFIEAQSVTWLYRFYKWLSETKHRKEISWHRPFFLDQNGHAAAAYDNHEHRILFLPVENLTGFRVVHSALLENEETRRFIQEIGIREPSVKDQIYNAVLPLYRAGRVENSDAHFKLFFDYYCNHCMNHRDEEFVGLIKSYPFLAFTSQGHNDDPYGVANTMYLPKPALMQYFEVVPTTRFVALDKYLKLVGEDLKTALISFLTALGVKTRINIVTVKVNPFSRQDLPQPYSTRTASWSEGLIEGCRDNVTYITSHRDVDRSVLLWNMLIEIIREQCDRNQTLSNLLQGVCKYFFRRAQTQSFVSTEELYLQQQPWLADRFGVMVDAAHITKATLSGRYDTTSGEAQELMAFLKISTTEVSSAKLEEVSNLTDTQREKIAFAERIRQMGIDESDFEELMRIKEKRQSKQSDTKPQKQERTTEAEKTTDEDSIEREASHLNSTARDVVRDIVRRTGQRPEEVRPASAEMEDTEEDTDTDADEWMPPTIDYEKRIERAKTKSASEIEKIASFAQLQERALSMPKYSYGWFKALLEMECLNSQESQTSSREVSISFSIVEREPDTVRTLVLRHPSSYIPQFIEDMTDIPLTLHMGDRTKTLAIEVSSIKSYTLRVKLKTGQELDDATLEQVTSAEVVARNPSFLLDELRKAFLQLEFEDDYSLRDNLCENIEFIFGPPGTGKTTYLAKDVLIPLMRDARECKALVLTPTNKAADVLAGRLMELAKSDDRCEDWLVRFGITGNEAIESSAVFRDKTFDIRTLDRCVTVTTIARFPYDFFMPEGARIFLNGIHWDYIIIDEASMIPLCNIVYPLYKKTPKRFIIAGDPFQIEPITSVELWKDENIYTLVRLNSFVEPKTIPHQYPVHLLTTQYRSIPEIGDIFSKLTYGGILQHHRSSQSQRPLRLGDEFDVKALNLIKYPVSKYESIYRAKRLQHSSAYQIYSALFTAEYIRWLSEAISDANPTEGFKLGVIAPYRAQADLIDKLMTSEKLPKGIAVQVGTIHGFQGDECDIIFAVLNTPPTISASKNMFLNKLNIINVALSRAQDYLFIVMPDDNTANIQNLILVNRVESLVKHTDAWTETLTPELEVEMFGLPNYLELNTFSTGHQSVNVYGLPENYYEVRTEDNAVDVQIHRTVDTSGLSNAELKSDPDQDAELQARVEARVRAYIEQVDQERMEAQAQAAIHEAEQNARREAEIQVRVNTEVKARMNEIEIAHQREIERESERATRLEAEMHTRIDAEVRVRVDAIEKHLRAEEEKSRLEERERIQHEAAQAIRQAEAESILQQIDALKAQLQNTNGLLGGFKRKKIQEVIDSLTEKLKSIQDG